MDCSFPTKKVIIKNRKKWQAKWFNPEIKKMRDILRQLENNYFSSSTNLNRLLKNNYRILYRSAIRDAKIKTNNEFIKNSNNYSPSVWKIINNVRKVNKS